MKRLLQCVGLLHGSLRKSTPKRLLKMALALAFVLSAVPSSANALHILLTNDDGYSFVGINTLRAALCAAGHQVTMLAPATNQSGRGGSLNVGSLDSGSAMELKRQSSDSCGVVYSLAGPTAPGRYGGTPVDTISAAFDVVLVNDPPDLVVSGLNIGQNMGKGVPTGSGTVGAAAAGGLRGVPSIAGSVGIILTEAGTGYPSTFGAFAPASQFMVRLIAALEAAPGGALLPQGVRALNINFPVPYPDIHGIKLTVLGEHSDIAVPLFDRNLGFPPFVPANGAFLNCLLLTDGQSCSVEPAFAVVPGPDPERNADVDAFRAGFISVTPMNLDMTAGGARNALHAILNGLAP